MRTVWIVLAALGLAACSSPAPRTTTAATSSAAPTADSPERPRLVIAIVLDQLPSHALSRYWVHLDEDGALRSAARRGVHVESVRYAYAGTNTAPGHAAIHTGAPPAVTGVTSNGHWDDARGREVGIVDDGTHPVHGAAGVFASPAILDAATVADRLRAETGGAAKVVSLSHKARSAVLSGGKEPTAAVWFEPSIPGFSTSSYYSDALPPWLEAFRAAHPPSEMLTTWEAEDPALYQRLLGPDDRPGEADWKNLGTVFPHRAADTSAPYSTAISTPQSADYLLELARAAIDEHQLGADDVPDLLAISISTTDYVGHSFGVASWEYLDTLRRVDRALGAFLREVERESDVAVLITSDHGGPLLPEAARAGGRLDPTAVAETLDAAVDAALGPGDWIAGYGQPFVFLTPAARARHAEIAPVLIAAAIEIEGVQALYDPVTARTWTDSSSAHERAIALSLTEDTDAFFLVPVEHWMADPKRDPGNGSCHGTPWDYDREVPVFFYGAGVEPALHQGVTEQSRVAATIAALLGVAPPETADPRVLPGAPAR